MTTDQPVNVQGFTSGGVNANSLPFNALSDRETNSAQDVSIRHPPDGQFPQIQARSAEILARDSDSDRSSEVQQDGQFPQVSARLADNPLERSAEARAYDRADSVSNPHQSNTRISSNSISDSGLPTKVFI